jgi:hypothetical protein
MTKNRTYFSILSLLAYTTILAQIDGQLYTQKILEVTDQWHTLDIPVSVLSKSTENQSDIRIYGVTADNDTLTAPYFIDVLSPKTEVVETPLQLLNPGRIDITEFVTLKPKSSRIINKIKLGFSGNNFDYRLLLQGSNDTREWYTIVSDYRVLSINSLNQDYRFTDVLFPNSEYKYYRVSIPKLPNNPSITSATMLLTKESDESYTTYELGAISQTVDESNITVLEIPLKNSVPLASLKLFTKNTNDFIRRVKISAVVDSFQTEKGWKVSYADVYSGSYTSFENHVYNLGNIRTNKLRVLIYHNENSPISINDVRIKGFKHRITARFEKAATYYLAYGNKNARKPQYDIALFKDKIPKDLVNLKLERTTRTLNQSIAQKDSEPKKIWLWTVMGFVILILGVFTLRMMRKV